MRHLFLATTAAVALAAPIGAARAQDAPPGAAATRGFDIPPQSLASALQQFTEQSGVQVGYTAALGTGVQSPGVSGTLAAAEALSRLLTGTGLTYRFTSANAVVLERAPQAGDGAVQLGPVRVAGTDGTNQGGSIATEGTGSYATNHSSFGKGQTLRELPQTVTVMTQQRIQDQGLTTLDEALERTPGLTIQQLDTVNSGFYSRGFPITNFQIDGNSPLYRDGANYNSGNSISQLDLAMFDSVEVLRGSDALYGTSGEPGGAINLVRKKPTDHFQLKAQLHAGSWNNYRGELDVGAPITTNGRIRARLVGVYEDREYFYDYGQSDKHLLYGIVEADITDSTMLTVGGDVMRQDYSGYDPYGLPRYSDGTDIGLARSFSRGGPDDRWLRRSNKQFVRIDQMIGTDWTLGIEASRAESKDIRKSTDWFGTIDPITFTGMEGSKRILDYGETQKTFDAVLKGLLHLFGGEHRVILWDNINRRDNSAKISDPSDNHFISVPTIFEFDAADYIYNGSYNFGYDSRTKITQKGVYGSFIAQIANPIRVIIGGRLIWYRYNLVIKRINPDTGTVISNNTTRYNDSEIFTPYLGIVYDISSQWSSYASFSETYKSQASSLKGPLPGTPLNPVTGNTYEVGIKGSLFDRRLNTTFALYHIKRNGEAVRDPAYPPTPGDLGSSCCYLDDGRVVSNGIDVEVSGEIVDGWEIQAGYTFNDNKNKANSGRYSTVTPRHLFKLWTSYTFQGALDGLKFGGGMTAQSSNYRKGSVRTFNPNTGQYDGPSIPFEFTDPGHVLVDLFIQYRLNEHWSASLNINNILNKKYYQTVGYSDYANFYGEPRSFLLTVRANY